MTLYLARRCTGLTLRELGNWAGGMDYSAVAASIRRFQQRIEKEKTLGAQAKAILKELCK
jgi:chromosomal replication initiation ATPase DnaA